MSIQKANKDIVRIEIADLINQIKEQSDRLTNQKEIPQEELDLILHKIEELHRKTVVWSYLNELPDAAPVSTHESSRSDNVSPEMNEVESALPLSTLDSLPADARPELRQAGARSDNVNPEPNVVDEPKQQETIQLPSGNRQLKDIQTFIGFNEKIMYIRQVFRGNNVAYDEALKILNSMNEYHEAEPFLHALADEFKWGSNSEPVSIFRETVKRRFS